MTTKLTRLICLAALIALSACSQNVESEDVRSALAEIVQSESMPGEIGSEDDDRHWSAVRDYYAGRQQEPAWIDGRRLPERTERLIARFRNADEEGLDPSAYATDRLQGALDDAYGEDAASGRAGAKARAELDVLLTHTLMRFASDLLVGRVDPRRQHESWNLPRREVNLPDLVGDPNRLDSLHKRLSSIHPEYGDLRSALQRYRDIARQGGWQPVPEGDALETGDEGSRVRLLRQRLARTGDLQSHDDTSAVYDEALAEAVRRFQRRHGLEDDGAAGEDFLTEANVPVEERIRQLELNLERWRWMPDSLGQRYLYVNIPAFDLHGFDGDSKALEMAVVVGEEYEENATPLFGDTMSYVVFQPYWNIPERIANEEILPDARQDTSYFAENDLEIVSDWGPNARVLDPGEVDLDEVESGRLRLRRKPGEDNPLGHIKFMFPNDHNIYLHDTPDDQLFEQARRAFSHGCIRVENPVELASFVMDDSEWPRRKIEEHMRGDEQEEASIADPVPIYILYWTAFVDDDGSVHFRPDLYGNDEDLTAALGG